MLAVKPTSASARLYPKRRSLSVQVKAQYDGMDGSSDTVGNKVEKWLKTPFDLAAFGPRAGMGALLSFPDRMQTLQTDINRAVELLQDPRPLEEKSQVLLKEVEDTVVDFLEKGATIETDILANVKTVLPPEVANALSEFIPDPPNKQPYHEPQAAQPVDVQVQAPLVTYAQADVQDSQVASEMTEIRGAVSALRNALEAVRTNTDIAATNMLRINLKEARDQLARRLGEVSPATAGDPSIAAATREAGILLEEVDAQFF